jgi:hypothetical protein
MWHLRWNPNHRLRNSSPSEAEESGRRPPNGARGLRPAASFALPTAWEGLRALREGPLLRLKSRAPRGGA